MTRLAKLTAATMLTISAFGAYAAGDAKHYPGFFFGATHVDSETDATFGIEYEYKLSTEFGVGGVWERTKDAHHGDGVNVWVGSFFYHPDEHWRLGIGFGEERVGGYKTKHHDLMRLSAAYEYHLENIIVAPELAVDFIGDEEATLAGVSILYPF
ncbi:hypothetical protein [Planctobacterium marinum]|uniref:Outer membrane protein beta-barrel domain-containing protein n=1 Tax=Planctobacterium marinum TaxID=1631968 RepID=A0AA48KSU6_9ALTE|nr:hypothetical protein MACH26_02510 [Planctobacterium marinum]